MMTMTNKSSSTSASAARLDDAINEQLTEIRLFREKLSELSREIGTLKVGFTRYEDNLETVATASTALGDEVRKTAMLMGRF